MRATTEVWNLLVRAYQEYEPDALRKLNKPVTPQELADAQKTTGMRYPKEFIELLKIHNGNDDYANSLFGHWDFVDVKSLAGDWDVNNDNLIDGDYSEEDHNRVRNGLGVKKLWFNKRWLPIFTDGSGNSVCVDYDPAPGGQVGQIIIFWHDDGERTVQALTFYDFFRKMCEERIGELKKEYEKTHPSKGQNKVEKKPSWWDRLRGKQPSLEGLEYKPVIDFKRPMNIRDLWKYYEKLVREEDPDQLKILNPPVTSQQLRELEDILPAGARLPDDYLQLLRIHNGGADTSDGTNFAFLGQDFLSTDQVIRAHKYMKERSDFYASQEHNKGAKPHNVGHGIQPVFNDPAWIPIFASSDWKEFYCLDFNPASGGRKGQIIDVHFRAGPWKTTYPSVTAVLQHILADELDNFYNWTDDGKEDPKPNPHVSSGKLEEKVEKKPGWFGWLKPKG